MENENGIRWAQSCTSDAHGAVREFHAAVAQPAIALIIFFCPCEYDLDVVADGLQRNRCVGFSSYGEQCRGVHINQIVTGIAIGSAATTHM